MSEKKRFIAMYTKHVKQKRKVYHDGFLDLHITKRKVMLYDESDNLLESKMLKADEVVKSGESLTFQAYLVDICEPKEGGSDPLSDPKAPPPSEQVQVCAPPRKPFAMLRPNFKKTFLHSVSAEEKKPNVVNKFPSNSLSPSHKMIRVFKKRELHKYGSQSPDTVNPTGKVANNKYAGTVQFGSDDKGGDNQPSINSPCAGGSGADSRLEDDELSKAVPPHKPLRDVNQILSFLQRQNVTETCFDNNPESDTNKSNIMESILPKAASKDSFRQQFKMKEETTAAACKTGGSMTHHMNDPPSFDLGI